MLPLSVIIPSYNRASVIDKTLQSLTRQSMTDFQTVIVDHGSTDTTVRDQMRDEFMQQAEDIFNYLTSLGQDSTILPSVPDEVQAYVMQPTLLVGGTARDAQRYDYVALADEHVSSTPSTWSCSGVLIPLPEQALGTVVVSDIWKKLGWSIRYPFGVSSMSLLEVLISEIGRSAKEAIFIHSSSVSGVTVETLEDLCHMYNLSYKIVLIDKQQESVQKDLLSVKKV